MSGQFIDTPAPKFIDAPAPGSPSPSGGLDLGGIAKKVGGAIEGAGRNFGAARTAAARDPVGALGNVLGGAEGAVAGAVMAPIQENVGNDPGKFIRALGHGIVGGATNPEARNRYNTALGDLTFNGLRPKGDSIPARIGRGAEDFAEQTMVDPVTHGGAQAIGGLLKGGGAVGGAIARGVKPIGDKITKANEALSDKELPRAIGKVAHAIGSVNPIPGMVNAGKDMLFLNPLPHGLGNMTALNFLKNGVGTTAKGLRYGVTGAPKATVDELARIKAGAWTPELMDEPSPWGPVGWMNALGKKGVPAAVRGGTGAVAGGAIANQTAPDTATPQQRALRVAEGSLLGGITGASPEVLNASNKLMSRLETGHRAAMLEALPKPIAEVAPKAAKVAKATVPRNMEQTVIKMVQNNELPTKVQGTIFNYLKAHPDLTAGKKNQYLAAILQQAGKMPKPAAAAAKVAKVAEKPDARADAINAVFGGGPKSGVAKIATALGGPFAGWQADVVPRNVGNALKNAPARVEAFARGQDITNRDVLKDQPYKMQVGGPIGGAAELAFNTPKYASRLLGPLGGIDPNSETNPKSFSLKDAIKNAAYGATPGREVVGPFFGDTEFPSKAPAVPSATLNTLLGYYLKNKTPATDAIFGIMKSTGLNQDQAARLYERYKR